MGKRWVAAANLQRGERHVRRNEPCEDAAVAGQKPLPYVAVSDGHGSERCTRSAFGAGFAVRCVSERLETMQESPDPEVLVRDLLLGWNRLCMAHVLELPLRSEERQIVSEVDPAMGPVFLYGATLLVAIALDDEVVTLRIGDGDVFLQDATGALQTSAEPAPSGSSETDSLCQVDAFERSAFHRFSIGSGDALPLVVVATDGFGAPFVDPEWRAAVVADIAAHVAANGTETLETSIADWCVEPARVGGDDTSMGLLVQMGTAGGR